MQRVKIRKGVLFVKKKKFILLLYFFVPFYIIANTSIPTLLIKIPTRSRPKQFFERLDIYYQKISNKIPYIFLISCDSDDYTMNNSHIKDKLDTYPYLFYRFSSNKTKIQAYNDGIDEFIELIDIILLASDDMYPIMQDYDLIIVNYMLKTFPDFDGCLNFPDNMHGRTCMPYPVIGKNFYKRFGYAYYPGYKSFGPDTELSEVARALGKEKLCHNLLIYHDHFCLHKSKGDKLEQKNRKDMVYDNKLYDQRKESGERFKPLKSK